LITATLRLWAKQRRERSRHGPVCELSAAGNAGETAEHGIHYQAVVVPGKTGTKAVKKLPA
jgi:hypothetical protein